MAVETSEAVDILHHLRGRFGADAVTPQETKDEMPTLWTPREKVVDMLRYLKSALLNETFRIQKK